MNLRWGAFPVLLVIVMLLAAGAACAFDSPGQLNDGQGTRDNPVPAREYAKTTSYDARALSVVRPLPLDDDEVEQALGNEYMRVQFEVRCTKDPEEICNLTDLRDNFQVVGSNGVLFAPIYTLEIDEPSLEGEILGGAEKAGWLVYEVPTGLEIGEAVVRYGEDLRVFFRLP